MLSTSTQNEEVGRSSRTVLSARRKNATDRWDYCAKVDSSQTSRFEFEIIAFWDFMETTWREILERPLLRHNTGHKRESERDPADNQECRRAPQRLELLLSWIATRRPSADTLYLPLPRNPRRSGGRVTLQAVNWILKLNRNYLRLPLSPENVVSDLTFRDTRHLLVATRFVHQIELAKEDKRNLPLVFPYERHFVREGAMEEGTNGSFSSSANDKTLVREI